jgi:pre-rRNA-processing protein TSR2
MTSYPEQQQQLSRQQQQQQQQRHNTHVSNYDDFQAGVTACLRSWSALRTAVESGWGGAIRESHIKAETLRQQIFNLLDGKVTTSSLNVFDLADDLAIFMEEEFSVTLEDQSEQQVAETIFQLYEDCSKGNTTLAQQLLADAETIVALHHQFPVQVQSNEHDDDDDDEDDDDMLVDTSTTDGTFSVDDVPIRLETVPTPLLAAAEYAKQPLFGKAHDATSMTLLSSTSVRQLGEAIPEEPAVEMDDDGFAQVVTKGRRNRGGIR